MGWGLRRKGSVVHQDSAPGETTTHAFEQQALAALRDGMAAQVEGVVADCRKQDGPYELMEPTHSLDAFTATRFTIAGTDREGGIFAFRDATALDFAVAHLPNLPYAVDRPRLLLIYFTMGTPTDVQEKPKTVFLAGK